MHSVDLYGASNCSKTKLYQDALMERGVEFTFFDVRQDEASRLALITLVGSPEKFPLFVIKGKILRNPSLKELDKTLARAGLYDTGLIHDEMSQRFIRHMAPKDAFVSYTWRDKTMVLGHIEVDSSLRGTGRGAKFAAEVFNHLLSADHPIRITCPFMRKVASTQEDWARKFQL